MIKNNFTTIIFDFDGTIADSFWVLIDVFRDKAEEFSIRDFTDSEVERFRGMTPMEVIKDLDISLIKLPLFLHTFRTEMNERIKHVNPFNEIPQLLNELKAQGFVLGIITSNSTKNVQDFLAQHKIDNFEFIYEDDSVFWKNRTMEKALDELKLNAKDVLYVGDQVIDVVAAKKEDIPVAAVTWGYNNKEILSSSEPTFLVNTPQELKQVVCS